MVVEGQMMHSMKWQSQALPCEMSDAAHAVFDGADGLLLGGATSIGINPVEVPSTLTHHRLHTDSIVTVEC